MTTTAHERRLLINFYTQNGVRPEEKVAIIESSTSSQDLKDLFSGGLVKETANDMLTNVPPRRTGGKRYPLALDIFEVNGQNTYHTKSCP